jgi:hypothetical protein
MTWKDADICEWKPQEVAVSFLGLTTTQINILNALI